MMNKVEKTVRWTVIIACELFTAGTIIMLFVNQQYSRLTLGFGTLLMIFIPEVIERLFKCKVAAPIYIFAVLYSIGPMLGHCHNLYYLIPWWDKLLHISGGVMFAILGVFLFKFLNKGNKSKVLLTAAFALCFSMAISVLWEFVEFSSDQFLHTDMQNDTVISSIHSYELDDGMGVAGSIEDIEDVTVNGIELPVDGYIDIGLIDTMLDMLLESAGALVVVVIYMIDREKHQMFVPKNPL